MHAQSDYPEDDWLALSGLQHFAFCRRQWALIHIEQQWEDNYLTTAGSLEHDRAHDYSESETRGSLLIMRDLRVFSRRLGITGACDVVEFRQSEAGVPLHGRSGTWLPYPVEYKHGAPKQTDADRLQLCAEAMCLEEMLACAIPEGALFYQQTRHRERVSFDESLRNRIVTMTGRCTTYSLEVIRRRSDRRRPVGRAPCAMSVYRNWSGRVRRDSSLRKPCVGKWKSGRSQTTYEAVT